MWTRHDASSIEGEVAIWLDCALLHYEGIYKYMNRYEAVKREAEAK